jgi:hypothetical protein
VLGAIECLEIDLGTERSLRDRDGHLGDQIVVLAHEHVRGADPQMDVEVAGAATAGPDGATTGEPQRGAGVDAGGHVDLVTLVGGDAALTATRGARRGDDLAETAAATAGAGGDHLAEQALADPLDLTAAAAVAAGDGLRSLAGTGAVAVATPGGQLQRHVDLVAEHRLLEGDVGDHLDVLATRRAGRPAGATAAERAAATATSEERLEDVTEATAEQVLGGRAGAAAGTADAGLAVSVVAGALLVVGQHLIGAGDLLELFARGSIVRVRVGMELASSRRYAFLISSAVAVRATPRSS